MLKVFLIVIISGAVLLNDHLYAQNFFQAYKNEIIKSDIAYHYGRPLDIHVIQGIDTEILDLKNTLHAFNRRNGYSILKNDTVFIINLVGKIHYQIIWNGKQSCYYKKHSIRIDPKKYDFVTKSFEIHADASELINEFPEDCKRWILTADTESFTDSAKYSKILQYSWLNFIRAVKNKNKWTFVGAGSYEITDLILTPQDEKILKDDDEKRRKKSR